VKLVNFNVRQTRFPFVKHRYKYFALSALLIVAGLLSTALFGLNLGVDFESGSTLEILSENHSFTTEEVTSLFERLDLNPGQISLVGSNQEIAEIRFVGTLSQDQIKQIQQAFEAEFGPVDITESTVSPLVAREQAIQAFYGILFASIAIVIYVAIRFEYRFGVAAVIALFHDVLIMVGVFSILRLEVDLTFIAAVLTIVGYSINDTIIIFDRIRDNLKMAKVKTESELAGLVNRSIVETLPRTINTSLTCVIASLALWLLGGEGIRNFSFAFLIGLIAGTYSSIFIASQLWFEWKKRELKKRAVAPQNT
jgi:preprotein translocase subunit SecF/SecD/SecF fusion protein